ncbi:MAG: hypothetical protein KDC01_11740 [Flavobacteriales bacterium]|jgi:hypothetical protein|nr:hypothetical protein [Flavobacteriales bacterium]
MVPGLTSGAQTNLGLYYGPRNYISAGTFNAAAFSQFGSFQSCSETVTAGWGPSSISLSGYWATPASPFSSHTPWPYEFLWHCSFDETFGYQHPSTFYAGVLSLNLFEVRYDGAVRYNYMLFELKDSLTEGVEYRFQGRIAAAGIAPSPEKPYLERIGVAALSDLPVPDSSYAFMPGMSPFVTTPANELVTASSVDLDITITGHGERYLVVGLFTPIDSLQTSSPAVPNTQYHYVLEDFFLYRPACNYATTMFSEPEANICREEVEDLRLQYGGDTSPYREWYVDGTFQQDSVQDRLLVYYGGAPETMITAITDTGTCQTSNTFTVKWRGVDVNLPDTFAVCGDPVLYAVQPTFHNGYGSQLSATWQELTGTFASYNEPEASVTFPDSGTYALRLTYYGCELRDTVVVGPERPLVDTTTAGAPSWLVEVGPEHCVNMNDGYVAVHDMGYPGTLHYDWSSGTSFGTDTSATYGLGAGPVQLRLRDDQYRCGDFTHDVPQLLDLCAKIQGVVYEDGTFDCVRDSTETGLELRTVLAMPVGNMAVTAADGSYEMLVPPGSYTVSATYPDPLVGNFCGNGSPVSLPQSGAVLENIDIADTTHIPIVDMEVSYIQCSPVVIGSNSSVTIAVRNKGELPAQPTLRVHVSPGAAALSTNVTGGEFIGFADDTLLIQPYTLVPGQQRVILVAFSLPADPGLMGDVATLQAAVAPLPGELSLNDNVRVLEREILASYDPNDKLVSPVGDRSTHAVDTTVHRLNYMVRFQNTGNYHATHVLLEDTLSPLLDPASLRVLGSSHPMQAYALDSILYFEFSSIMLPDSASDPEGSQGWVIFELDVAPGAQYGDSIRNIANIYFDQNPPIITPPATTRFAAPLATALAAPPAAIKGASFMLVPNPAHRWTAVRASNAAGPIQDIELLDMQGRPVRASISDGHVIGLDGLACGTYVVLVRGRHSAERLKLLVH